MRITEGKRFRKAYTKSSETDTFTPCPQTSEQDTTNAPRGQVKEQDLEYRHTPPSTRQDDSPGRGGGPELAAGNSPDRKGSYAHSGGQPGHRWKWGHMCVCGGLLCEGGPQQSLHPHLQSHPGMSMPIGLDPRTTAKTTPKGSVAGTQLVT